MTDDMQPAMAASDTTPYLSVMAPVYGCADTVAPLVEQVSEYAAQVTDDFEIVLVEDGSPDGSWEAIEAVCGTDPRVKGVSLSRNFGQHYAVTAGLAASRGSFVIVLDCDLQDHPRYIPELVAMAEAGYDIVYTRKRVRKHRGVRNFFGRIFHWMLNLLADPQARTEPNIGNYSILSRQVVDSFLEMKDYHRHYLGLLRWMGFDEGYLDIDHYERTSGESAYTFRRLFREAVVGITSQSERLLHLTIGTGFVFVALALIAAVAVVVVFFVSGALEGWTSLMVVLLLSTGVILTSLGIVGLYVGKTFEQSKDRPLYLVKRTVNLGERAAASLRSGERGTIVDQEIVMDGDHLEIWDGVPVDTGAERRVEAGLEDQRERKA